MRDTESHPPSLPKFLKQPLVVCNGIRKKKPQKENSAFLRHYKRPIEDEQGRQLEEILGRASQTPTPSHRRRRGATAADGERAAGTRGAQTKWSPHIGDGSRCAGPLLRAACACPLFSWWRHYYAHFIDEKIKKLATRRWSYIPRPPQLEKDGAGIQSLAPSLGFQPWVTVSGLSPG